MGDGEMWGEKKENGVVDGWEGMKECGWLEGIGEYGEI